MKVKTVVVDDQKYNIDMIIKDLKICEPEVDMDFELSYFEDPMDEMIIKEKAQFYILDINMPKRNGFELARLIFKDNPETIVVFCSYNSSVNYNSTGFGKYYFLNKEMLDSDLKSTLLKVKKRIDELNEKYEVCESNQIIDIYVKDIAYFEQKHMNVLVHKRDGAILNDKKKFADLVKKIGKHNFIHAHRFFLINSNEIVDLSTNGVKLKNGENLPVTKYNYKEVREKFMRILMNSV